MPGTPSVLGSSLTRTCFFLNGLYSVSIKKLSINYLSAYLLSAFFLILELLFIVLELRLYFVILLTMTFYFLTFFCFV